MKQTDEEKLLDVNAYLLSSRCELEKLLKSLNKKCLDESNNKIFKNLKSQVKPLYETLVTIIETPENFE